MQRIGIFSAAILIALIMGLGMFAPGSTSAYPGAQHPSHTINALSDEQRRHIQSLKSAYRAAVSNLDWSIGEHGHAPETMQRMQELRLALHAGIMNVMARHGNQPASTGTCPYSGKNLDKLGLGRGPTLTL